MPRLTSLKILGNRTVRGPNMAQTVRKRSTMHCSHLETRSYATSRHSAPTPATPRPTPHTLDGGWRCFWDVAWSGLVPPLDVVRKSSRQVRRRPFGH